MHPHSVQPRRFVVPRENRATLIRPPLDEAGALAAENVRRRTAADCTLQGRSLADLSRQARIELIGAARAWTSTYRTFEMPNLDPSPLKAPAEIERAMLLLSYIAHAYVDGGPVMKRWRARARGRVARIKKRTCHITVRLAERPVQAPPAPLQTEPAAAEAPKPKRKPAAKKSTAAKKTAPAKKKEAKA